MLFGLGMTLRLLPRQIINHLGAQILIKFKRAPTVNALFRTAADNKKAVILVFTWNYGLYRIALDWVMVPGRGVEPPTFALRMRCSTN